MFRNLILLLSLLLFSNCATSGSAFLGPIFTGAKTGSIYQASISYSTGKLMNEFISSNNLTKINENQDPVIVSSYKIDNIIYSEIIEEEHLP